MKYFGAELTKGSWNSGWREIFCDQFYQKQNQDQGQIAVEQSPKFQPNACEYVNQLCAGRSRSQCQVLRDNYDNIMKTFLGFRCRL